MAWHPWDTIVATQSSDRTCSVHNLKIKFDNKSNKLISFIPSNSSTLSNRSYYSNCSNNDNTQNESINDNIEGNVNDFVCDNEERNPNSNDDALNKKNLPSPEEETKGIILKKYFHESIL